MEYQKVHYWVLDHLSKKIKNGNWGWENLTRDFLASVFNLLSQFPTDLKCKTVASLLKNLLVGKGKKKSYDFTRLNFNQFFIMIQALNKFSEDKNSRRIISLLANYLIFDTSSFASVPLTAQQFFVLVNGFCLAFSEQRQKVFSALADRFINDYSDIACDKFSEEELIKLFKIFNQYSDNDKSCQNACLKLDFFLQEHSNTQDVFVTFNRLESRNFF